MRPFGKIQVRPFRLLIVFELELGYGVGGVIYFNSVETILYHLKAEFPGEHLVNQVLEILLAVRSSVGGERGVGDAAAVEQPRDSCEHAKVAAALGKEREGVAGLGVKRDGDKTSDAAASQCGLCGDPVAALSVRSSPLAAAPLAKPRASVGGAGAGSGAGARLARRREAAPG